MSSELVPTAGAAGARRTDEIAWQDQPSLAWHHWPPSILSAAPRAQPLAELALRIYWDDEVIDGVPHELAVTWRAHADGLFVARAVRRKDGTRWVALNSTWRPSVGVAKRTSGVVATQVHAPGAAPVAVPGAPLANESRQAPGALGVLPLPVQSGVRNLVPDPDIWIGSPHEVVDDNGRPWRYTSRLLRLDAERAVVISAHKGFPAAPYSHGPATPPPPDAAEQLVSMPWHVTQLVYEFAAPTAPALDKPRRRLAIGRR